MFMTCMFIILLALGRSESQPGNVEEWTSQPYIRNLMDSGSDVIILSEHWLWPFEMQKLKEIHSEFNAECVTDSRLNDTSTAVEVSVSYGRDLM